MTDIAGPLSGADPEPAFLELGERLRQRGQLEAALSVAIAGVTRHPQLAAAHDLVGRVRADQGDDASARQAWLAALECESGHPGALKGLAFLAFRNHDLAEAERRLEQAVRSSPGDAGVVGALDRVRAARNADNEVVRIEDGAHGLLLVDRDGYRLVGDARLDHEDDRSPDLLAADAAAAAREAVRLSRLLELGEWQSLVVESRRQRAAVVPVRHDATLLLRRSPLAPVGRLMAVARRAAVVAGEWIDRNVA